MTYSMYTTSDLHIFVHCISPIRGEGWGAYVPFCSRAIGPCIISWILMAYISVDGMASEVDSLQRIQATGALCHFSSLLRHRGVKLVLFIHSRNSSLLSVCLSICLSVGRRQRQTEPRQTWYSPLCQASLPLPRLQPFFAF